jgi:hypothetical protein
MAILPKGHQPSTPTQPTVCELSNTRSTTDPATSSATAVRPNFSPPRINRRHHRPRACCSAFRRRRKPAPAARRGAVTCLSNGLRRGPIYCAGSIRAERLSSRMVGRKRADHERGHRLLAAGSRCARAPSQRMGVADAHRTRRRSTGQRRTFQQRHCRPAVRLSTHRAISPHACLHQTRCLIASSARPRNRPTRLRLVGLVGGVELPTQRPRCYRSIAPNPGPR